MLVGHPDAADDLILRFYQWLHCSSRIEATRSDSAGPYGELPCGACLPCKKIQNQNHPDVVLIRRAGEHLGGEHIGVDDLRELKTKLYFAPLEGRFRLVLISRASALTTAAANALLKTLEEPPAHTRIVLTTLDKDRLPATILSRVQCLNIPPLTVETISQHIDKISQGLSEKKKRFITMMLAGAPAASLNSAKDYLNSDFLDMVDTYLLSPLPTEGTLPFNQCAEDLNRKDEYLTPMIDGAIVVGRDTLQVLNKAESYELCQDLLQLAELKDALQRQGNKKLVATQLAILIQKIRQRQLTIGQHNAEVAR
jgi:hypothetical protein